MRTRPNHLAFVGLLLSAPSCVVLAAEQPTIVLTPAQPKAMQPFDAEASFRGAPMGHVAQVYEFSNQVHVNVETLPLDCSSCAFGDIHAQIPGLRVGTYSLAFGEWDGPDEIYASSTFTVTTDFKIDSGVSGSWYEHASSGQGFNIEVIAGNQMLVYFYTYDATGHPTWMFGVGNYVDYTATIPLYIVQGSRFEVLPYQTQPIAWGTLTLAFSDCNTASASWTVTDDAQSMGYVAENSVELVRLTTIPALACPSSL